MKDRDRNHGANCSLLYLSPALLMLHGHDDRSRLSTVHKLLIICWYMRIVEHLTTGKADDVAADMLDCTLGVKDGI